MGMEHQGSLTCTPITTCLACQLAATLPVLPQIYLPRLCRTLTTPVLLL